MDHDNLNFDKTRDLDNVTFQGRDTTVVWTWGKWKTLAGQLSRCVAKTDGNMEKAEEFLLHCLSKENITDPLIIQEFRARTLGRLQNFYAGRNIPIGVPERSGRLLLAHREYVRSLHEDSAKQA